MINLLNQPPESITELQDLPPPVPMLPVQHLKGPEWSPLKQHFADRYRPRSCSAAAPPRPAGTDSSSPAMLCSIQPLWTEPSIRSLATESHYPSSLLLPQVLPCPQGHCGAVWVLLPDLPAAAQAAPVHPGRRCQTSFTRPTASNPSEFSG